jgi:hypothetical protein
MVAMAEMTSGGSLKAEIKAHLTRELDTLHTAILGKLDGLSEYDLRRPLTPTGTNVLGVVKHLASIEAGYLGDCFGRPWPESIPWLEPDAPINADMWATPEQSSGWVRHFYVQAWEHGRETIAMTDLTALGTVAWWAPERRHPSLAMILIHLTVETARHAGHLDIVRELIDERTGRYAGDPRMPGPDDIDWNAYRALVEQAAQDAR